MSKKIAIAIAIEKTQGKYDDLPGAGEDARDFLGWAKGQGFQPTALIGDDANVVRMDDVRQALKITEKSNIHALYLFFSGHGLSFGLGQDYWLLSEGSKASGEVVDVYGLVGMLRQLSLRHVAIFADACRSHADASDLAISRLAVPPAPSRPVGAWVGVTKIDQFYATRATQEAIHLRAEYDKRTGKLQNRAHGLFTKHLLNGLCGRAAGCQQRDISTGGLVVRPVPLEAYLYKTVCDESRKYYAQKGLNYQQYPDCYTESREVLARVTPPSPVALTVNAYMYTGGIAPANITILRYDASSHGQWHSHDQGMAPYNGYLPAGNIYGVKASLAGHSQVPPSPSPITHLASASSIDVVLVPDGSAKTLTGDSDQLDSSSNGGRGCALKTLIIEPQRADQAPHEGVFLTRTTDGITGAVEYGYQFLADDQIPEHIGASHMVSDGDRWISYYTIPGASDPCDFDSLHVLGDDLLAWSVGRDWNTIPDDAEAPELLLQVDELDASSIQIALTNNLSFFLPVIRGFCTYVRTGPEGLEAICCTPTKDRRDNADDIVSIQAWVQAALLHDSWKAFHDSDSPLGNMYDKYGLHPILTPIEAYSKLVAIRRHENPIDLSHTLFNTIHTWFIELSEEHGYRSCDLWAVSAWLAHNFKLGENPTPRQFGISRDECSTPLPLLSAGWTLLNSIDDAQVSDYLPDELIPAAALWTSFARDET